MTAASSTSPLKADWTHAFSHGDASYLARGLAGGLEIERWTGPRESDGETSERLLCLLPLFLDGRPLGHIRMPVNSRIGTYYSFSDILRNDPCQLPKVA